MRGTVLLLDSVVSPIADVDLFRARGLMVYYSREPAHALEQLEQLEPDVVVAVLPRGDAASIVTGLRQLLDRATSIIVASEPDEREAARQAGADSFVRSSAPPTDLLYEIHRALILRRSGRRLPFP